VGQHAVGYSPIIVGQGLFGEAGFDVEQLVWMGETDGRMLRRCGEFGGDSTGSDYVGGSLRGG
jgi:hypothetical protein